jgi:hypothetical protein
MAEFLRHVATGAPTTISPIAARESVAAGALAAESLRNGSTPRDIPQLPAEIVQHFARTTAGTAAAGRSA